jgi:hypothetical protein
MDVVEVVRVQGHAHRLAFQVAYHVESRPPRQSGSADGGQARLCEGDVCLERPLGDTAGVTGTCHSQRGVYGSAWTRAASAPARQVGVLPAVGRVVKARQQGHDPAILVADGHQQPRRASDSQIGGVAVALGDDEAGDGDQGVAQLRAQVAGQAGAAPDGQGAVAAAVNLGVTQAASAERVAVGRGERQPRQQRGVGAVQHVRVGPRGLWARRLRCWIGSGCTVETVQIVVGSCLVLLRFVAAGLDAHALGGRAAATSERVPHARATRIWRRCDAKAIIPRGYPFRVAAPQVSATASRSGGRPRNP